MVSGSFGARRASGAGQFGIWAWLVAGWLIGQGCGGGDESGENERGGHPTVPGPRAGTGGAAGAAGSLDGQTMQLPRGGQMAVERPDASMADECAAITETAETKLGPVD